MPARSKTGKPTFLAQHAKAILAIGLVLIVSFGLSRFAAAKASSWHHAATVDQQQAQQDMITYQEGEQARLHAKKLRREIKAFEQAVPDGEDQPSLVASVSHLANKCQASWASSSWSSAPGTQGIAGANAWTVNLDLSGTVQAIQCMLFGLPYMPRIVNVTSVDLSYQTGGIVQANLTINVFGRTSSSATAT